MRRVLKWPIWLVGGLLLFALTAGVGVYVAGNTDAGRTLIERLTDRFTGGHVKLTGLGGSFPTHLTLDHLDLIDAHGIWLSADHMSVTWEPLALLAYRVQVSDFQVARVHVERAPYSDRPRRPPSVPDIEVAGFSAGRVELAAPLVGNPAALSAHGKFRMRSLQDADTQIVARRLDGDGDYNLRAAFDPAHMDAMLQLREPAGGPLEHLLQLPGLGALSASVTLTGPRSAERLNAVLDVGDLHARANGTIDLAKRSADAGYSVDSLAVSPRADLSWQRMSLRGHWHGPVTAPLADGRLTVDRLRIGATTEIAAVSATLSANGGVLAVKARIEGLKIPGPQPLLFATEPVLIDASMLVKDPTLPLRIDATHPLLTLRANARIAEPQSVVLDLRLPDVAPLAAFAKQDVRGDASIHAKLARAGKNLKISVDANAGFSAGTAGWIGVLGKKAELRLAGMIAESSFSVESLRLAGGDLTLTGSGSATRAAPGGWSVAVSDMQARWELAITDLAGISPQLAGQLKMTGRMSGPPNAFSSDAEVLSTVSVRGSPSGTLIAELHGRGLPSIPSGSLQIHGKLDDAPLNVDVAMERNDRGVIRGFVRHAEWKSAHAQGLLATPGPLNGLGGEVRIQIGDLGDFDRLLGLTLGGQASGYLDFKPVADGPGRVQLQVTGTDVKAGRLVGDLQLHGEGTIDALGLKLDVQEPALHGAPASLESSATLKPALRELHLMSAAMSYRGQTIRLLAPATVAFSNGVAVDALRIGVDTAVLAIKGRISPTLDLNASLRGVKPPLVNLWVSDLLSAGSIEATASIQGDMGAPTGNIQITAAGVRFMNDAATGLPAMEAKIDARLLGDNAAVDGKLTAGADSTLTAAGTIPLNTDGSGDLKVAGHLDVGLLNPLLEARGLHAAGKIVVDAAVTGPMEEPEISGKILLEAGNIRDYSRGINLSQIRAEIVGKEGALQIKSFSAKAATGTVSMSGSVGLLQPHIPVDLQLIARNAQVIASSIVTATLDADLHVKGMARERLDVSGKITSDRTTIGIPSSLPPEVAVLDVRRRGQKVLRAPEKHLVIGLDVAVVAPQEILVEGRGLNAELGGELHVRGTTNSPQVSGGFDLRRGTFDFAGKRLDFTAGRVSFDGAGLKSKIDPTLDFTAQTVLADVTATLRITGVADAPRFEFSSVPTLPQDDIMARLLYGEPGSQLTALQAAQIAAALASLSGVGGSGMNPLVKLQKTLGLERLSVGAGASTGAPGAESSGASIEAGRHISKRIYIAAKQTTAGGSQVQVDVELTKHLKLQTKLGNGTALTQGTTPENDPGSSIGLSYQFEY